MCVVAGSLAGTALAAEAQQAAKIARIGFLAADMASIPPLRDAFLQALHDLGYVEGRNVVIETRMAESRPERLAWAAAELVGLPVDVLATWGTPASRAAKHATTTIPVVAIAIGDPVRAGLAVSLARPGGNITGNTILSSEVVAKRLQFLKELIPHVNRVGFLWNPDNDSNAAQVEELKIALPTLGMSLISVEVRNVGELDGALASMMRERPDAFQMTNDPFHQSHMGRIIGFVDQSGLPGMYQTREVVAAGGLISYGPNLPDLFLRGANYVHKIFQGAKPAEMPVEQPTTFELVINLKTAKALGLTIPPSLLQRADQVIE
jgi:putative ABC transport system substrate-binding protein